LNPGSQNLFQGKQGTISKRSGENYTSDIVLLCNGTADSAPYAVGAEHYLSLERSAISKMYDRWAKTGVIVLCNCNTSFVEMGY